MERGGLLPGLTLGSGPKWTGPNTDEIILIPQSGRVRSGAVYHGSLAVCMGTFFLYMTIIVLYTFVQEKKNSI